MKCLAILSLALFAFPTLGLSEESSLGITQFEERMLAYPLSDIALSDLPQFRSIIYIAQQKVLGQLDRLRGIYTEEKQVEIKKQLGAPIGLPVARGDGTGRVYPIRHSWAYEDRTESTAKEFGEDVINGRMMIGAAKKSPEYGLLAQYDAAKFDLSYYEGCSYESSAKLRELMNCPLDITRDKYIEAVQLVADLEDQIADANRLKVTIEREEALQHSLEDKLRQIDSLLGTTRKINNQSVGSRGLA